MILYGRNPIREALRGRRANSVGEVWATPGAAREPWLMGVPVRTVTAEEIERRCGSDAHQGICADAGPYHYASAEELLAGEQPLLVVLDQVQDPQNLGSICRTAECAGAAGVVIPERRAAEVTAAVCKASAGAVEHLSVARVRNLADFLADARKAGCWCYGAAPDAARRRTSPYNAPDYGGAASCWCWAARARPAPAGGGGLRRTDRAAAAREDRLAGGKRGGGAPCCTRSCRRERA